MYVCLHVCAHHRVRRDRALFPPPPGSDLDSMLCRRSMLARRLQLLAEVEKLARTLGIMDDVGYTCETANHFWLLHVYSRWEEFLFTVRPCVLAKCAHSCAHGGGDGG